MSKYSASEKKAFRRGLFAGLSRRKEKFNRKVNKPKFNSLKSNAQPMFKGPVKVGNKFYNTNFLKPIEITKNEIKDLRKEYEIKKNDPDELIVQRYVDHMRQKFGVFDKKTGAFIGLLFDR